MAIHSARLARRGSQEVVADPDLVELLAGIPLGMEIPAELYQAVAESWLLSTGSTAATGSSLTAFLESSPTGAGL
ncbi:MAG: hypothetical protein R2864_04000 [Syntrophotaleaceae bacterium]